MTGSLEKENEEVVKGSLEDEEVEIGSLVDEEVETGSLNDVEEVTGSLDDWLVEESVVVELGVSLDNLLVQDDNVDVIG